MSCVVQQSLTDGFAGGTETVLHALVALAEALGDLADLHAAVDVEAVDPAAAFGQTGKAVLQALGNLADAEYRLGRIGGFIGVFQIVFVGFDGVSATVVVGNQVSGRGVGQCGQGDVGNHLARRKKAEEDILYDVLRLYASAKTAADVGQQLVAVAAIIVD